MYLHYQCISAILACIYDNNLSIGNFIIHNYNYTTMIQYLYYYKITLQLHIYKKRKQRNCPLLGCSSITRQSTHCQLETDNTSVKYKCKWPNYNDKLINTTQWLLFTTSSMHILIAHLIGYGLGYWVVSNWQGQTEVVVVRSTAMDCHRIFSGGYTIC